jgi:hypothetical protein
MGKHLDATGGLLVTSRVLQWEKDRAAVVKCHNNDAERPFAFMKWLARMCPSMTLPGLSSIARAIVEL